MAPHNPNANIFKRWYKKAEYFLFPSRRRHHHSRKHRSSSQGSLTQITDDIPVENTSDIAQPPAIPAKNLVKHTKRKPRSLKSRLQKLLGLPSHRTVRHKPLSIKRILAFFKIRQSSKKNLPEEYFLQRASDGSFTVVKNKAVTASGMNEEHMQEKTTPVHTHSHRHKKSWFKKFVGIFRKRKHRTPKPDPALQKPEKPKKPSRKELRKSFVAQLSILVKSWLSLRFVGNLFVSTLLFIVAYIITWFIYSVAVVFTASFFNINAVMLYYEVMWPAGNAMPPWSAMNTIAVTMSGPLVSLAMSFVYFYLLRSRFKIVGHARTLLFWLFALSLAHFFGAFAAGVITWEGFGYVMEWLHLHTFFLFLFSTLFLTALVFIGWKYARFVLEIRPLHKHGNNIPIILANRMVIPYVFGTLLLLVIKYPNASPQHPNIYDYDAYILASVLFLVVPPLFNTRLKPVTQSHKSSSIAIKYIKYFLVVLVSIGIIAVYRLGLSTGLYVYMKFVIDLVKY